MRIRPNRKRYTPASIMTGSKLFQDFQRAFAAISGLPLTLAEPAPNEGDTRPDNKANPFCVRMTRVARTCEWCREFQAQLADAAKVSSQTRRCHAGLYETMVPVRFGKRVLALLQIGQVRLQPTSDEEIKQAVREVSAAVPSINKSSLATALGATRTFDREHFAGFVQVLEVFSSQLAEWYMRNGPAETPRASTPITRAREWLGSHYHERITLDDAAKAVHLNRFHFSKAFHRETGVRFRDFLVQLRLDRARLMLAHNEMRITEIAGVVGFQSISQFDRTFRRAFGQSARAYRRANFARQANIHDPAAPRFQQDNHPSANIEAVSRVA